ncbi:MAG: type VI secretion system protein TssA, partial [Pseudomonadota bacterium]|nr:type VI secretion system protein TssA [Pseudomonadota bacterium]
MSVLELEKLLAPVSPDAPSGEDMEYDPAFQVMRRAAEGQPERHMGSSVVPAEEPDWQLAGSLAAELLMRTKDLRIAVTLTRARLHTEGFVGMRDGLALTRRLLIELWDSVHPQLDPEEDNDPTERVNALLDLCGRETLLNPVRTTPLVNSRVFGPVTLRDIEIAEGKIAPPPETDAPSLDMAAINGAFLDCELGGLRQTATDITASLADLKGIETAVTERVGAFGQEAGEGGEIRRLRGTN